MLILNVLIWYITVSWTETRPRTCNTVAPTWRNCNPDSAESMPPVARMGKPGRAFAMADTARNAIGRMAFPAQMQAKTVIEISCYPLQPLFNYTKININSIKQVKISDLVWMVYSRDKWSSLNGVSASKISGWDSPGSAAPPYITPFIYLPQPQCLEYN